MALITAPDRPAGRGRRARANPMAAVARERGLPVLQPERASTSEALDAFRALAPDLGVVVAYGQILSPEFLAVPREGCINLHASLLPRWRGASPIQAALLAGDPVTGDTLQRVVPELDAGPVLARRETPVGPRETAPELAGRLAELGAALLTEFLDEIGDGPLPPGEPQDPAAVTRCRRLRREDAWITWSVSANEVDRRVRAMAGWPVAEARLPDGEPLKVHAGEPLELPARVPAPEPGTILDLEGGLLVACGRGGFRATRLQRPGRRVLAAGEFLRGCPLRPGQVLGPGGPVQPT